MTIDDLNRKQNNQIDNNNEKIVKCDSSIKLFIMNEKDSIMVIILDNNNDKIIIQDLNINRRIEHHNQMKLINDSWQIIFIHLGSLWSGYHNEREQKLEFQIQQINDFSKMTCSIPIDHHHHQHYHLSDFYVNKDMLLCLFESINKKQNSIIQYYQLLDTKDLKRKKYWQIYKKIQSKSLKTNVNNTLIAFIIEDDDLNVINLIDLNNDKHPIEYKIPIKKKLSIVSIEFDSIHSNSFCLSTNRPTFYFCFYSPDNQQCYQYDSITIHDDDDGNNDEKSSINDQQLIAYKIPDLFIFKSNNNISIINSKHQKYYLKKREFIEKMFVNSLNDEFRKYLFDDSAKDDDDTDDNYELWRLMARKFIMENNIDWTLICLAKMGNVSLVRILRQEMAIKNGDENIVKFLLMLHLDLLEESEEQLEKIQPQTKRCRLYCLQEKWSKAFECADKIELKNLYYQYAKQMEMENRLMDSILYFERSDNIDEIVRMLFENGNINDLKNYCLKKHNGKYDRKLVSWWGQYCESQNDHSTALEMYHIANDYYNLVRLLCHLGQKDKAIELVDDYLQQQQSNDNDGDKTTTTTKTSSTAEWTGAIRFLGKHLESIDSLQSIDYYLQCLAIRHAIRVAITYEHYDKLVMIANKYLSINECKNIINRYFTLENDFEDKQVSEENMAMLYYKANFCRQAILFAIKHRLWSFLRRILNQELEKDEQINILQDDIDLLIEYLREDNSIIDIVIDLILISDQKQFDQINSLIQQFGIDLNDQIMEKLEQFITKHSDNQSLIETIAELCLQKGDYQLAAKLYNKLGRRIDSMKALIRTGQSDKIIQFANVARDKIVFKLAANFLQTINYDDTEQVIRFYTKAQAFDELERYRQTLNEQQ